MKIAFTCSSDKETDGEMGYLYAIKAAGEGDEAEDWTGKMNETKRTIMSAEANIKTKIDAKIDGLNSKMDAFKSQNEALNTKMDTMKDSMDTKMEALDAKMDTKMDQILEYFKSIEY